MNTYSALYYPYRMVKSESLLKYALLFWDELSPITVTDMESYERLIETRLPKNSPIQEAAKLIISPHFPTEDEKKRTHEQIINILEGQPPSWFYPTNETEAPLSGSIYIYHSKFWMDTWSELRDRKLIESFEARSGRSSVAKSFGLLMMAILADNCASYTRATVTDEQILYEQLFRTLAVEVGTNPSISAASDGRVLTIAPVLTPLIESIPIENLIALRKREKRATGHHYEELRHKFFDQLKQWSENLANKVLRESDFKELLVEHERQLNRDFSALREELALVGRGFILSKEMGAMAVVIGGSIAAGGWAGPAFAIPSAAALTNLHDKYKSARFKALHGHFSSYLYLAKKGGFECDFR